MRVLLFAALSSSPTWADSADEPGPDTDDEETVLGKDTAAGGMRSVGNAGTGVATAVMGGKRESAQRQIQPFNTEGFGAGKQDYATGRAVA